LTILLWRIAKLAASTASTVTKWIKEKNTIIAGSPAFVVKENISWNP
jgi:hypothetical protein